jgi:HSP20 family protein
MSNEEKFDPMREIAHLRDSVGKVIEQGLQSVQNMTSRTAIKIDVYEIGDAIVVRTQPLDGLVASSIEVSVEDKVLTFSGVTQADDAPVDASYILQERTFGTFSRQIALPLPVKAQEAKAKVKQGILTIELPIDRDSYTHIDIMD